MKLILELVLIFSTVASLRTTSAQSCKCAANYQPFCGTDDVTYSNRCILDCARSRVRGLEVKFEGVCAEKSGNGNNGRVGAGGGRGGAGGGRRPAGIGGGDLDASGSEIRPSVLRPPGNRNPYSRPAVADPTICHETRNGKAFRVVCKNPKFV